MIIRLVFEPEANVNCNHDDMFRFYSENYLSDFETTWGGYIVIDNFSKKHYRQEPCYQRYIPGAKGTQETLDKITKYKKEQEMINEIFKHQITTARGKIMFSYLNKIML